MSGGHSLSLLASTEEPLWPVTGKSHRHVTKAAEGSQKADVMFYKKKALEPGLNARFGGFSTPLTLLSLLPFPLLPQPLLERRETLGEETRPLPCPGLPVLSNQQSQSPE